MNDQFGQTNLSWLNVKLRYIPIIMPPEMKKNYPERSRARIRQGIYDCAPQLDYETFVSGTRRQQFEEYFRGIATSTPHLKKFGATAEQVAEFERILAEGPGLLSDEVETQ